jgi:hypothetical protein
MTDEPEPHRRADADVTEGCAGAGRSSESPEPDGRRPHRRADADVTDRRPHRRADAGVAVTPRRVAVTSPRTAAGQRARPIRRRRDELADQTEVGEVLIRSLIRAQLGLALRVLGVVVVLLGGPPLAFAVFPATGRIEIGGVGLPWLLLGVAAFPLLVLLGLVYMRQAERHEREFAELVEH